MEVFNSPLSSKPYFPSPFFSTTSLTRKIPFKFHKPHLKPFTNPPFLTILPLKISKNSFIFAQFGGPTKRRNSLRKKLNGNGGPQVRQNPQKIIDPVHQFVDNNHNFDSIVSSTDNSLEKGKFELGGKRFNLENNGEFGGNLMWGKLEGWIEQYKKDIEFWGIGSNPIFTVFQDSSGNVGRVLVDEDEIIRRSGFDPFRFRKEERVLDEIGEVNEKVCYARNLAKEVESGKSVISRNSCVTKFVGSSENERLGFVGMIRSVFVKGKPLRVGSRVGVAVVCGFVLVWVVRKVWGVGVKEVELTGFEKEMLRRKMKSRMVKEKSQVGGVEVVEKPIERAVVVAAERPRIDKEEVLNMIREVKGSDDSVVIDVGSLETMEPMNMDSKIKEIQMMARHARKIEKGVDSPSESDDLDVEIPKKIYSEEKTANGKPEDLSSVDELEKEALTVPPNVRKDDTEELAGNMKLLDMAEMEILGNVETQSSDAKFTSDKVSEWDGDVEPLSTSSGRIIDDEKSHINGVIQSHDLSNSSNLNGDIQSHIPSSQLNSQKKTPTRRMPKIIRSVKEAKEYLSKKLEVGDALTSDAISRLGENDVARDSSDVERTVPSKEVSQFYNIEQNESVSNDTSELVVEKENELNHKGPHDHSPCAAKPSVDIAMNLGQIMESNEMYKLSGGHERSDFVSGENDFCDGSEEANQHDLTKPSVEKVDKLDEKLKPTVLSELSDLDSERSAFQAASNSTEELGVTREPALHHADLKDKLSLSDDNVKVKVDGINGTPKPTELSDIFVPVPVPVPVAVGRNSNGSGSKDKAVLPIEINDEDDYCENEVENMFLPAETFKGHGNGVDHKEGGSIADKENWLEKNFHEVEPIMKKISSGFKSSYNLAREKIKEDADTNWDLMKLSSIKDDTELEWMQDDKLREIVFRVRDNELAGRDPFHSMNPEDKVAFFEGLEKKVEKENQKLSILHEWLHSNIENIDYGADGISIYDPPEKVIPRWKGPPLDTISEFLNSSKNQQAESSLQKTNETTEHNVVETSSAVSPLKSSRKGKNGKVPRTVIEASDGSIKPGKKSGKEFWQHTKKWSRGFVESYNAETDPEVKSVMKDMGKDLDRWITEKEIKEAAEFMDNIPQQKEVMEKKLKKLKREMELFGPQAVVSKYREYAEEKEVDYLWWLDLPHVLCIELYTYEGEDQQVGFYTLEMAEDLELEPKPCHVIAFQDPGDCKNFCYIIQAHLEMLGKGKAFIVPQPPKDVFWQAKGNGFGVTVIRKGELKLNVDQPLEEVEELISEIGSTMYHDKLMRERSVDISSLMKGVFGVSPPSNRRKRTKRARKRPSKS